MSICLRTVCFTLILPFILLSSRITATEIKAPVQPIPSTYFGLHIHRVTDKTPWPAVAVPTCGLWDAQVKWPDLEPSKGHWQFDTLDKYVALAERHHTQIPLPLAVTPQWASSQPNKKSGWQKPGLTG